MTLAQRFTAVPAAFAKFKTIQLSACAFPIVQKKAILAVRFAQTETKLGEVIVKSIVNGASAIQRTNVAATPRTRTSTLTTMANVNNCR